MISPVTNSSPVQMNQYQKRDSTFAEILHHEIAIRVDKVATPEGQVLWERNVPDFNTRILEFAKARGVSDACMARLKRTMDGKDE